MYRFADLTVRSLLILNGGAALALLTFATGKSGAGDVSGALATAVALFGTGAWLSVATVALAYFAQRAFVEIEPEEARLRRGKRYSRCAIAAGLASLFVFGVGMYAASTKLMLS
jgi:hypothetical protein